MLRRRLATIIASIGIVGAAALVGSAPASAGAQPAVAIVVTPNTVAPGGQISYAISNAICVPGGTGAGAFQWSINDTGGTAVSGPFVLQNDGFTGGAFTSNPLPGADHTGDVHDAHRGRQRLSGLDAQTTFTVQAPTTTAPPTTVAPTTTPAPTTTAAAAVPPAPTTAAPTTTAVAPAAAPAALPATGQELDLAVVALLLCLGGGGLVVATRRR